jgi:DNA-binding MarR family transcriptional regulator
MERFEESVPHLVGILFRHVARVHGKALKPMGVSAVEAHILASLFVDGTTIITELQKRLGMGSSTITAALDRMQERGLVRRLSMKQDRRMAQVIPDDWTPKRQKELLGALSDTEDLCFGQLTMSERRDLVRLLKKAITSIEAVKSDE